MQKQFFIIILFLGLFNLQAQKKVDLEKELKDLHIAMEDEMAGKEIDYEKHVKVFLDDGTVIKKKNVKKYFDPEKYDKLIYLDNEGEIKAFVFSKIINYNIQTDNDPVDISPKQKAIYFNVTDINGNQYSLDRLKGKVIVMNYWFSACRPCVMEMPELNKLVDKYKDKDVVFIGFTYHIKYNIERFIRRFEFKYNLIPESQIEILNYHVETYPTHIVIDQNGYIVLREEGLSYDTVDVLDKTIEALLNR